MDPWKKQTTESVIEARTQAEAEARAEVQLVLPDIDIARFKERKKTYQRAHLAYKAFTTEASPAMSVLLILGLFMFIPSTSGLFGQIAVVALGSVFMWAIRSLWRGAGYYRQYCNLLNQLDGGNQIQASFDKAETELKETWIKESESEEPKDFTFDPDGDRGPIPELKVTFKQKPSR